MEAPVPHTVRGRRFDAAFVELLWPLIALQVLVAVLAAKWRWSVLAAVLGWY